MAHYLTLKKLPFLLIVLALAACSGGGGGSVGGDGDSAEGSASGGAVSQGVAVDPYIAGAVFQEIAAGSGAVLQARSSASDAFGVFTFPQPLTPGSIVEMKTANKGLHGGSPYPGMLRRLVGDDGKRTVVVSPLTTLLANGAEPEELVAIFDDAGLSGLSAADFYKDPMQGLAAKTTGITDQNLKLLQAAMAANAYMEITGNFQAGMHTLNDYTQFEVFSSMVNAMVDLLNPAEFASIIAALANDPDVTTAPILEDLILAVLAQQQTIVAQVKEGMVNNGAFSAAQVTQAVQAARANGVASVKLCYSKRVPISSPYNGATLYQNNCASCHHILVSTTKSGRSAADIQTAIDNNYGGMGVLSNLTAGEVAAIVAVLQPAPTPDPVLPPDGTALYGNDCAGCHGTLNVTSKPGRTAAEIQAAINGNMGGMGALSALTTAEVQAIAHVLPPAPVVDPVLPPDGTVLYGSNCSGCHGMLSVTTKPGRTAAEIQAGINGNMGGMGAFSTLTTAEVQAIADVLPPAPVVDPVLPPDGTALYGSDCAGCHGLLSATTKPARTAAQIQAAINGNMGGMGALSAFTTAEVQAIADVLPPAPIVDPVLPPDGTALYGSDCAGCHGTLNVTTKPGRTAAQIQAAIIGNMGGMGALSALTTDEVQAIADVLPAAPDPGPDYSNCTLCHAQPPSGNSYPNIAGAHAAHAVLPSVGANCSICHQGAGHNSQVDLGFPVGYNAKSGTATANTNNTCSSIKCHGGKTTPNWVSGSIAVNTQCTSCHASGSAQYNSYSSGQHSRHTQMGYGCTVCHNTTKLQNGHFNNLESSSFELSPAATVGGGSTSVGSYSSGTCSSINCHGSERW